MTEPTTTQQLRVGVLTSHPIQYQAPWFRSLAREVDLVVFFAHRPTPKDQGIGFGKEFTWDIDLLSGYEHHFLKNISANPNVNDYNGCDTPEIEEIISHQTKERQFDAFIVPGWYLKCYWQAVRACRKERIPVLVRGDSQLATPRSWLKKVAKEIYYRWMLRKFDGFLSVGKRHQAYLEHYGVASQVIFSAPHFVDNEWFAKQAKESVDSAQATRSAWGTDDHTVVCLFVGKFEEKKRPLDLIRAVGKLGSGYKAVLVGSGELDPLLKEKSAQLNIDVHFAGFKNQSELPACYAAADCLVLPSDGGETWGLVVNEAMACGIPAVVSEAVGCAPDLIDEGTTGFVFPLGDIEALSSKLSLLAEMKNQHHDWSAALHEKLKNYSVQMAVSGTVGAIRTLTKST